MAIEYIKKAAKTSATGEDNTRDVVAKMLNEIEAGGEEKALEYANQLLSGKQARAQFSFKFDHAIALVLGKFADAIVGKLDVVFFLLGNFCDCGIDLLAGHNWVATIPAIQLLGVFQRFFFSTRFDFVQHFDDNLASIVFTGCRRFRRLLDIFDSHWYSHLKCKRLHFRVT